MSKQTKGTIKVDGRSYSVAELSEDLQSIVAAIEFCDEQIQQRSNEIAVADTARIGYSAALKSEMSRA